MWQWNIFFNLSFSFGYSLNNVEFALKFWLILVCLLDISCLLIWFGSLWRSISFNTININHIHAKNGHQFCYLLVFIFFCSRSSLFSFDHHIILYLLSTLKIIAKLLSLHPIALLHINNHVRTCILSNMSLF